MDLPKKEKISSLSDNIVANLPSLIYLRNITIQNEDNIIWININELKDIGYFEISKKRLRFDFLKKHIHPDDVSVFLKMNSVSNKESRKSNFLFRIKNKITDNWDWFSGKVSMYFEVDIEYSLIQCQNLSKGAYFENKLKYLTAEQLSSVNELTKREKEVLTYVCKGFAAREIATELNISKNTIVTHKENISKKLGVRKSTQLASFASMVL